MINIRCTEMIAASVEVLLLHRLVGSPCLHGDERLDLLSVFFYLCRKRVTVTGPFWRLDMCRVHTRENHDSIADEPANRDIVYIKTTRHITLESGDKNFQEYS
jgi:hypothetical protein